jgi:succinoglycan biosynthesis transport protein ExoP
MDEQLDGKSLSIKDYVDIIVRRRWFFMAPMFTLGLLGLVGALLWPPRYRSEALILVEQQKIPERYVTPNVVGDLQERLQSMTQQILSRTRLQRLIEQLRLYPDLRARKTMDDVVDRMRKDIEVEPIRGGKGAGEITAFRISYATRSPSLAQQVTNELTSLFIEENLQARTEQSESTTAFLESQLEQARQELAEQEKRMGEYKARYLGELPEQEQSNMQILSSLESQLQSRTTALDRAQQEKVYLESMRSEYVAMQEAAQRAEGLGPIPGAAVDPVLSDLQKQLAEAEAKYTPEHPDVVRLRQQLEQWKARHRKAEAGVGSGSRAGVGLAGKPALAEVESRLKALNVEIQSQKKEMEELSRKIREYQARLSMTPLREQQLAEVLRSYQNSKENYQSLLQKRMQSELATSLEKRQQGEQFRILDPPSLPQKPAEPNRPKIVLIGWALGLGVGAGLAALREFTDRTLHSEKEVSRHTGVPVLAGIPVLRSGQEEARRKRRLLLEVASVTVLLLISVVSGIYTALLVG